MSALLLMCMRLVAAFHFNSNGQFKIVQFTDLHFNNDNRSNDATIRVMYRILDAETPDFVVLSGDVITGDDEITTDTEWFPRLWKMAVSPMVNRSTPYSIILGNHDGHAHMSRTDIVQLDMQQPMSATKIIPGIAASNYFIDVVNATTGYRMWFFDSMDSECRGRHSWGCVDDAVVDWATQIPNKLPGIAFIHIPIYQMDDAKLSQKLGIKQEFISKPRFDTGIMHFTSSQNVGAMFFGHDHGNDFSGKLAGVTLAYGRNTGYGGYDVNHMMKGARVIQLELGAEMQTWIRLENGTKYFQTEFRSYIPSLTTMVLFVVFVVCCLIGFIFIMYKDTMHIMYQVVNN